MTARDELYELAQWGDDRTANQKIDNFRAQVLAEADLLPKADVVAWLTKKAREGTPVWDLASKVERGAIRPNNLRMLPPDFFEPGRTYTNHHYIGDYRFQCVTVTAHPTTGERVAIGWETDPTGCTHLTHRGIGHWRNEYDDGTQATGGDAS